MATSQGIVTIHGKQYKTVALRVNEFRSSFPDLSIQTDLISNNEYVVIKAIIIDENDRVRATGYAEEQRNSTQINKTSALENCETSAIGRALACFGLAGEEYASANEVVNAIYQQENQQIKWYNDFDKQKDLMLKKIQSGEQTAQGIIAALEKTGLKVSNEVRQKIINLRME